jgi:hypothetical protein
MLKKPLNDFFRKARRLQAPLARTPQINCGSPSPRPVDSIDRDSRPLGVFLVGKRAVFKYLYCCINKLCYFSGPTKIKDRQWF